MIFWSNARASWEGHVFVKESINQIDVTGFGIFFLLYFSSNLETSKRYFLQGKCYYHVLHFFSLLPSRILLKVHFISLVLAAVSLLVLQHTCQKLLSQSKYCKPIFCFLYNSLYLKVNEPDIFKSICNIYNFQNLS